MEIAQQPTKLGFVAAVHSRRTCDLSSEILDLGLACAGRLLEVPLLVGSLILCEAVTNSQRLESQGGLY